MKRTPPARADQLGDAAPASAALEDNRSPPPPTSTQTLHILVIPSWFPTRARPGLGLNFLNQAIAFQARGHRVGVIYPDFPSVRKDPVAAVLPRLRVKPIDGVSVLSRTRAFVHRLGRHPPGERFARTASWLFDRYVERFGVPDVIRAHSALWAGVAANRIARRTGLPYVISEHRSRFVASPHVNEETLAATRHPSVKCAFESASCVVTVSQSMNSYIAGIAPSTKKPLITIPNMVDTDLFSPGAPHATGTRPFRFISVGGLIPLKGFDVAIAALRLAREASREEISLRIVGSGPELDRLRALAAMHGLADVVSFAGQLDNRAVAREMSESDAFVLATRYEAFGIVFIEALAAGLPVIGTRSGGPIDIVNSDNGLLVDVDDHEGLATAMAHFVKNRSSYDREGIRRDTIERFGRDAVSQALEAVLVDAVLSTPPRPRAPGPLVP